MPRYLVAYGKLKLEGGEVTLTDTYFGAYEPEDSERAEAQARACVNAYSLAARSFSLPRIVELQPDETVVDGLYTAAEKFEALVADQAVKDRLKTNTEAAVARGAFGAPTFFVEGEMFFGQDRLDFVEEALA